MPYLDVSQTSIALALIGGWISICGLFTFTFKTKLYLSEPLLCVVFGILAGPNALGWLTPLDWTGGDQHTLNDVTFEVVRIVIGIQVLYAGVSLPKAYLKKQFQSLCILLGPVMVFAWLASSLLIWGLFPKLKFLEAMVIASAITPTDPVLANSITQGRFADKHVPVNVRNIIVAESGANDGLGYPFIYLALNLILYPDPQYENFDSLRGAIGNWFLEVWLYQIALSIVEGLVIGYVARKALKWAKQNQYVEHTSFLGYGVGLAFLTLGFVGMVGGDDILCCFIAGNSFTWDDYYRLETEDSSFQDVIDTLLSSAVFIFIGALIPWDEMTNVAYGITVWRLVVVSILILILRRFPWVVALTRVTPAFESYRESAFAGFFGPIGVSAVFYVQVALRVLPDDETSHRLRTIITPIVYFIIFSSILVHGCTIPLAKGWVPVHTFIRTLSYSSPIATRMPSRTTTLAAAAETLATTTTSPDMADSSNAALRPPAEETRKVQIVQEHAGVVEDMGVEREERIEGEEMDVVECATSGLGGQKPEGTRRRRSDVGGARQEGGQDGRS